MKFISIDLNQDILDAALDCISERCIMVFPTRVSANLARLRFEPRWHFQQIIWTTMEDFKAGLVSTELPRLEDEKRLLCLYQVLTQEECEYFHLSEYNDVVDWGNHFFQFLQEYSEAGRDVNQLATLPDDPDIYLRHWQEEHIGHIANILERYRERISEMGFTDIIFSSSAQDLQIPYQDYRIVLVNQYYYSKFEQELLHSCEHSQNEVWLLHHGGQADAKSWQTPGFDPAKLYAALSQQPQICIYQCENEEQHALLLLTHRKQLKDSGTIIDNSFWQKAYSAWFPQDFVKARQQLPITQSLWYGFMSFLDELVQSQQATSGFVPLSIIIRQFRDFRYPALLQEDWDAVRKDALLRELFKLSEQEVLYLDLNPLAQFGPETESQYPLLSTLCSKLFAWVEDILNLKDIGELIQLCTGVLAPEKFCSPQELDKTDILPQIWKALANFSAVENMRLVQDWAGIFPAVGAALFRLWLDYVKPERLRYQLLGGSPSSWEISNLLDFRNRRQDNLVLLQMVEGILPQSPGPVWLLNEGQRARLGLLNYDIIRAWERYYFFRMVFSARKVSIYTYQNAGKSIEPSSFIGELKQICPQNISESKAEVIPFGHVLRLWQDMQTDPLQQSIGSSEIFCKSCDADFFRLPPQPLQDFGEHGRIRQSSYELGLMINNPFAWYIRALRKLSPRKAELAESISPSLFGTLMHHYFNEVLGEKPQRHESVEALSQLFSDGDRLRITLQQIIQSREFYYKIPKNYNQDFLLAIISECLADSLQQFYSRFFLHRLGRGSFTLIPESRFMSKVEQQYKELCRIEHQERIYRVMIRGKADLRIESPQGKIIVDFKTGSAHASQLIFYEYFYYLLENPQLEAELSSYFWQILDMRIDYKNQVTAKKREQYISDISQSLKDCLEQGYGIATKAEHRGILQEITRSDLYLTGGIND
ncbi:MAG: PD-(D/E)XK nuclease family protein [Candidatus Cloacimonadaceae bacterium]|jgi:hypothetical protein|nr:PD-(D/E)XK nuclease family protein [Candidatus Cloacimonadota bacterium]MCB5255140.1 PD-(D/E)XK nuclease family protein [Candidatus Cloacimonadota bacterium]MCK9178739.1 PD-(D/E)XK nuclease family protein [Candidatus Cloacimonadota bacterium]MCK9241699.1 PD-(D/E)XK nuclease family protein [Candidatus Cloacimonadota bacterium]MDY0127197.1 PD-(D/E)XK nuclease family protein [Candidatus Cloacimonadaceae bacterium]